MARVGSHMIVERGTKSDAELVRALSGGDVDAFAALVERYRDACTRFAVRMTGSALDADDVMQSVWMRALRNIGSCRNPDRFGAWLYQIVINESRTYTKRRQQRDSRFIDDEFIVDSIPAAEQPDLALRDETLAEIQRALDCLPAEQREAFVLKYVEEMDYETMAELTGVGVSALKMRVSRACDRLRVLLEGVNHA
jgi:RNA polymerase sigma-70 factor (ECF subfamily)